MARREARIIPRVVANGMSDGRGTTLKITMTTIEADPCPHDEAKKPATETETGKGIDHPGTTVVVGAEVREGIDRHFMEDHQAER